MSWANLAQLLIAALTVLAGVYATRAAKRGKAAELRQQSIAQAAAEEAADRKQRFEELDRSLGAARKDLDYYEQQLDKARQERHEAVTEKDRLQAEWIERHRKLLARCQQLAAQIHAIINGPIKLHPAQQQRLEQAVEEVAAHIQDDHLHFD
jgi:chromosome segregation ATPase